jgi:LacI family transcriptional regulator
MPRARRIPAPRRVALLIEASRAYARGLVRGVAQYNRQHQGWAVFYTPRGLDDPPPAWLRAWEGDGILARINDRRMAQAVARKRVPVVELRRALGQPGLPSIGPDDEAVARLAAEHLRQCGFQQFGFIGLPRGTHPAMDLRADAFAECLAAWRLPCARFHLQRDRRGDFWEQQCRVIIDWLRRLPQPVGLMACNDDLGLLVLDACRRAAILVPDQVAVLGVGNDECLCDLAVPPLSSVDLDPQRIGYEAAQMLDCLMARRALPEASGLVPPRGVVARASTDVLAVADQGVVRAVRLIRQRACGPLQVAEVLREARMSRAALEPRLKRTLGRTIHQEIDRVRIARVKELLLTTTAPLKQIAQQAGYRYPEYMMRVFRRTTGQTPGEFRKQRTP